MNKRTKPTEKLKVFLVEDEDIILKNLLRIVDWSTLGYTVCGTAHSYEEALAIAKYERPDLMISDIMLGNGQKTGLDLVKTFSALLPKMQSLILTGYDSFEFARDAIGYTVKAYLLKPLNVSILTKHLREIKREVLLQRQEENRRKILDKQIKRSKPFLFDWLMSYADQEEQGGMFGEYSTQAGWQPVVICLLDRRPPQKVFELFLQIEDIFTVGDASVHPFFNKDHFILICHMQNETSLCSGGDINDFIERLQEYIDFRDVQNYLLCAGRYATDMSELRKSYQQALALSEYRSFLGDSKQIYYTDIVYEYKPQVQRFQSVSMQLRVAIQTGNYEEAVVIVTSGMNKAADSGASISLLRSLAYEAFVILDEIRLLVGLENELESIPEWTKLDQCKNLEELSHCLSENYRTVGMSVLRQKDHRLIAALEQIKKTIDTDFAQDLSLNGFAKQVFISSTYLSTLFSEKYGVTFKNYLTSVRMEAAKKLIAEGAQKIYMVAEQVGYTDTRYFSQVFRKYTGYTPLEYRSMTQRIYMQD
ncbi:MAG: helix-turn-helix domain-containing protein [Christensenellales bacterium]